MAEPKEQKVAPPSLRETDMMAIISTASQSQAEKVRLILERFDDIAGLDPRRVENIASLLNSAKADGGCGIGCW
jgi:hypothetical protein